MRDKLLETKTIIDNEYFIKYLELIKANKNTQPKKFITHKHHIIPRYVFVYNNEEVDNSEANLINLNFCDHLLAHYYLMKCAANTQVELANANAIFKSINNPHTLDIENWIISNKKLLNSINKRRCELLSLHHQDVAGIKNPRATKIYRYKLDGTIEVIYPLIKDCAAELNRNPDSFRAMLARDKALLINNKVYSKNSDLPAAKIEQLQKNKQLIESRQRNKYTVICEICGKSYDILASEINYKNKKHHYCYACSISGKMFLGKPKSELQREHMRQAYLARINK